MILEYIKLFFTEAVKLFFEMAPYIMLGILIAGVLHVFLSKDFVARHVGGNNLSSVFKAALFGVPLPLCSCGVVPTAVYLKNSGASKAAVTSFLISTPQTGVDSIAATYGMLGPVFAFFKAAAALIMGMAGGMADFLLEKRDKTSTPAAAVKPSIEPELLQTQYPGFFGKIKEIFRYAFFELLDDIAVNFIIGLAIAAVISIVIPENFFSSSFLANPLVSMVIMVIIGIPMYICSTSSIPIAVALIAKGISPGAAYVFLVAGPATNAASLAIISKALGKKTTIRYLITIITGSLLFGFLMNMLFTKLGISPFGAAMNQVQGEKGLSPFIIASSLIFLAALIFLFARRLRAKLKGKSSDCCSGECSHNQESDTVVKMTKIAIEGMTCGHCKANVEKALSLVSGIDKIEVNLDDKCAYINGNFTVSDAEGAVKNAGYTVIESAAK
ncbi:MAG: SO_0444 family Cu/Zn efflux transporter [Spirochaetales bacterium]|nr:SO_0444 family Cu/Zn efflux transporter [Spirochaetales bacterium]